ncbi:MAG: hypothetical protein VX574_01685 [Myxococcota bacterium]|nr:hypothetical protein [Myxococcota bacterium]
MTDWRLRKSYGFGAGQVRLVPHPASFDSKPESALVSIGQIFVEWREIGWAASFWRAFRPAGALAIGALLLMALAAELRSPQADSSDLQLVEFSDPPAARAPAPAAVPASPPVPSVEVVSKAEPTTPPPVPEAPPITIPSIPEIASPLALQAPLPPQRTEPVREAPRPAVHIEKLEALTRPAPPVATLAARAPRTALERPTTAAPSPVAINPLASHAPPRPPRATASRPSLARPAPASKPGRAAFRPAPIALAGTPGDPPPRRNRNATGSTRPHPNLQRSIARPVALAAVGLGAVSTPGEAVASAVSGPRAARIETVAGGSTRPSVDETLAGVPLSALAACVSDREEDRLKLEILASVSHRTMCSSGAGRYRFVETKNLNAFLMWIERASHRAQSDRCVELRHALDCLQADKRGHGEST